MIDVQKARSPLSSIVQAFAANLYQDRPSREVGYRDGFSGASFDPGVSDAFSYANGFSEGRRDRRKNGGGAHAPA